MSKRLIFGDDLKNMIASAELLLRMNVDKVNDLNVFPVPDGDTGSNMHRTLAAGLEGLQSVSDLTIGETAGSFANGLQLGARGNSGVILSQLFRGFAEYLDKHASIDGRQLAEALQAGVNAAYDAVVNPIEGTILTVAREAAKQALKAAKKNDDAASVMIAARDKAQETLAKTPQMLEVLREVGVVDSGGQGLVIIYEGFVRSLTGEQIDEDDVLEMVQADMGKTVEKVQAQIETESIEHFYDMEFFIEPAQPGKVEASVKSLRKGLKKLGDSILVVPNNQSIKVHVHSKAPGEVLSLALRTGELRNIHIENMREQHRQLIAPGLSTADEPQRAFRYSMIAAASGDGIAEVLRSIGVEQIVLGGQTMNPSTDDLLQAIRNASGDYCLLLPNNSNIKMAAEQAKRLAEKHVEIIPTRTIQQGVAAALAFREDAGLEQNIQSMSEAASQVKSGQVTFATRDAKYNQISISKGEALGIAEEEIVASSSDRLEVCLDVLHHLIQDDNEIVTIFAGIDADPSEKDLLIEQIEQRFPDIEIEWIEGQQPVYFYLFSVE